MMQIPNPKSRRQRSIPCPGLLGKQARRILSALLALLLVSGSGLPAAAITCNQATLEPSMPAPLAYSFQPRAPVRPFYQWLNNNGYCGEVSLLEAGLANGQWISQANSRSIASPFTSYTQTGRKTGIKFYSQMLLDDYAKPTTTTAVSYGKAALYMKLAATSYPSSVQTTGQAGFANFMRWIKAKIVAGDQVTLGVINAFDTSPPYSHIVNVIRVESNYPASDTAYHADDVLYIDDHGLMTLGDYNPAIPPGTTSTSDCAPFVFGYSFAKWATSVGSRKIYGIPLPTSRSRNYAYAVSGVLDSQGNTLPVQLSITNNDNPMNPIAGYNYEAPMIGTSIVGNSFTNTLPTAIRLTLSATVSGLVTGNAYNLYLYKFTARPLLGAFAVPTSNFNANAGLATQTLSFVATGPTYTSVVEALSSDTIAFRAVPATAP